MTNDPNGSAVDIEVRDDGEIVGTPSEINLYPVDSLRPKRTDSPLLWPCSFEPLSWEHRSAVLAASNPADIEIDPRTGYVDIVAVDWLIMPVSRVDEESGEEKHFTTTVLFARDGSMFKTSSDFAPQKMAAALAMFDRDDWQRGIPFRFSRRVGKSGRTYHDMRLAPRKG